jgi:hypothetical protein
VWLRGATPMLLSSLVLLAVSAARAVRTPHRAADAANAAGATLLACGRTCAPRPLRTTRPSMRPGAPRLRPARPTPFRSRAGAARPSSTPQFARTSSRARAPRAASSPRARPTPTTTTACTRAWARGTRAGAPAAARASRARRCRLRRRLKTCSSPFMPTSSWPAQLVAIKKTRCTPLQSPIHANPYNPRHYFALVRAWGAAAPRPGPARGAPPLFGPPSPRADSRARRTRGAPRAESRNCDLKVAPHSQLQHLLPARRAARRRPPPHRSGSSSFSKSLMNQHAPFFTASRSATPP